MTNLAMYAHSDEFSNIRGIQDELSRRKNGHDNKGLQPVYPCGHGSTWKSFTVIIRTF